MNAIQRQQASGWLQTAGTALLLGAAAVLVVGMLAAAPSDQPGFDFRGQYFAGAQAVADGRPLYVSPDDRALEAIEAYVYPPQLAVALVPLTPLPEDFAVLMALLASLGALLATLAVVGVRDVRCYAVVLLWWPAWTALSNVNLTIVLALAVAVAWRVRARLVPLALVIGTAVSAKLLLWPLFVWAVATRRFHAAFLSLAVGVGVTAAAWAVIGFQGLTRYPELLQRLGEVYAHESYSFVGMADVLGLGERAGHVAMLVAGGALLLGTARFGRQGDDGRSYTAAVAGALALTPIVWQHYLLLLLGPLGIARPRLSAVWVLPLILWLTPHEGDPGTAQAFLPALVATILLVVLLTRPSPRPERAVPVPA